jgi:hypothetical protein
VGESVEVDAIAPTSFLLWEQEGTGADLAAVTDGTVIAVCTKAIGRRISPPEKIRDPRRKTKTQFGGLFGGLFLTPKYDIF